MLAPSLVSLTVLAGAFSAGSALDPQRLWAAWPETRAVGTAAPCLRPAALTASLEALAARFQGRVKIEEIGRSVEGRPIRLLSVGSGPRRVLFWSQMHGDEPSATPALLDLTAYLLSNGDDPDVNRLLESATLLMIPMLNPDGAERYERRNAQGIDVNRDALNLATPEGRLLKAVRDRFEPELGFNLHDQGRRTRVGETGKLATISLLAVAGDAQGTLTPGRARAKRVCSALVEIFSAFVPGGIARYDEDWSPRAFGDNLTAWGTPVVLIESGGAPDGMGYAGLTRLDFVGLLSVLGEWAKDDLAGRDDTRYETLPRNERDAWADVVIRGGSLFRPGAGALYRADLAFDVLDGDRALAGCADAREGASRVVDLGDARFLGAGRLVDATGAVLAPGFAVSVDGLAAREWLNAKQRRRLARLGVVELRWHVAAAERAEVERLAGEWGRDEPRAVVVGPGEQPAALRLAGPAAEPRSRALSDVLAALAGDAEAARLQLSATSLEAVLERLSRGAREASSPRVPSVGGPASFVILEPPQTGAAAGAGLRAVYVDGREIRPEP